MCLYPKFVKNPKYIPNEKNKGKPPEIKDKRTAYVPVGCGNCIECRRQKKREWQIRMNEEIETNKNGKFITLTFSNEELQKLTDETGITESNAIATIAIRRFLERWRKKYKKSVRHWLVTELGHKGTERIHLHGIIFTDESNETIEEIWKYGIIWVGKWVNSQTINYIIKYITKIDEDHKGFKPVILASAGIGNRYTTTENARKNKYKEKETNEAYRLPSGAKSSLPIYYRNKIYTEEERENLWLEKLDKQERYVNGIKISVKNGEEEYNRILKTAQEDNKRLGYGDRGKEWSKKEYNVTLRQIRDYNKREKELKESVNKVLNNLQE